MALDRPDIIRRSDAIRRSDGARRSAREDEAELPREAYAFLAQANLLRMRGCWDEAVGSCMAALRLAPDSPSAQSLLGDIYENQGRFDDAIQWYRMALDANPESRADRLKLDRLLQRQPPVSRAERKTDAPKTDAVDAELVPVSPPLAPFGWRLIQNPESALRYGALLAAALVSLVVILAYAAVHRRTALASLGLGSSQEVKAAPVVVPSSSVPSPSAGTTSIPRDAAEQAVLETVRGSSSLSAQGVTVDDLQFDPRTGRVSITISLSSSSGLTQAAILRGALHTVQVVAAASPSATVFTLRCLIQPAAGGAAKAFIGDMSRSALPADGAAEPDDSHVEALWTSAWWSSQMPGLDAVP